MSELMTIYAEFWPHYLREHRRPGSRALHYFGSVCGVASLVAAVLVSPWFLLVGPFVGYGPAWIGHFVVEKNKPATFGHPLWSLVSDYRMFGVALIGRLQPELDRAQLVPQSERELTDTVRSLARGPGRAGVRPLNPGPSPARGEESKAADSPLFATLVPRCARSRRG